MSQGGELPAIAYGPGPGGFGVLNVSPRFSQRARLAFLDFAKAVSWRPAKLKASHVVCLALVPSPDGVVACRLTECGADAYGRNLAMRVEGILCGHDDRCWRHFTAADAWPSEAISNSSGVVVSGIHDASSVVNLEWTPASGRPLILAPRTLVNAPAHWFAA